MLYEIFDGLKYTYKIGIEALVVALLVFVFTVIAGRLIIPVLRAKKLLRFGACRKIGHPDYGRYLLYNRLSCRYAYLDHT